MNDDPRFLRSRVRHELLPLLRELNPRAAALAARAADATRASSAAERRWTDTVLADSAAGLSIPALAELPAELRGSVLRGWMRAAAPAVAPTARLVGAVERLSDAGRHGGRVDIAPGWCVERFADHLSVRQTSAATPGLPPLPLRFGAPLDLPGGWRLRAEIADRPASLPDDLWTAVCDLDKCESLVVRSPRVGERTRPLGMRGSKTLGAIFGARRVPRDLRGSYPVVACGASAAEVVWVPGVVRAAVVEIDASTRRFAVLSAENTRRCRG